MRSISKATVYYGAGLPATVVPFHGSAAPYTVGLDINGFQDSSVAFDWLIRRGVPRDRITFRRYEDRQWTYEDGSAL